MWWGPGAPLPAPWSQGAVPTMWAGGCPTASLGWVAELLNGLEDSLHVPHFGDPQVLQEGDRS